MTVLKLVEKKRVTCTCGDFWGCIDGVKGEMNKMSVFKVLKANVTYNSC